MHIGIDVGGANTDIVRMDGGMVLAWTKAPTTVAMSKDITRKLTKAWRRLETTTYEFV